MKVQLESCTSYKLENGVLSLFFGCLPLLALFVPKIMAWLPVGIILFVAFIQRSNLATLQLNPKGMRLFLMVVGCMLVSLIWANDPSESFSRILKIFLYISAGFFLWSFADFNQGFDKKRLGKYLIVGFCIGLVSILFEVSTGFLISDAVHPNTNSPLPTLMNRGAVVLSLMVWPVLYVFPMRHYLAQFVLMGASFLILIKTSSDSAAFAVLCAFAVFTVAKLFPLFATRALKLFLIGGVLMSPLIAQGLFKTYDADAWKWSAISSAAPQHRLEIWSVAAEKIAEKPVLGWGVEAGRHVLKTDRLSIYTNGYAGDSMHPHNAALQIWLEFGVIGILLAVTLIWGLFQRLKEVAAEKRPYILGLITSISAVSMVSHGIWQSWWLGTILSLLLILQLYMHGTDAEPS